MIAAAASVEETLDNTIDRIHQIDPTLRAWVTVDEENARRQARGMDALSQQQRDERPLLGMVIGVKDVIDVAGFPTRGGSSLLANAPSATADAPSVASLRRAGAVVLGKTETTVFAFYDPAPTRNPHNIEHTPGGSSSGSAAAVAAGLCTGALGTQTFGSVIRPASYCGIIGLKPTYDRISRDGVLPLAWSLDHVGFFSRSAREAILLADALLDSRAARSGSLLREDPSDRRQDLRNCTVGIPDRYFFDGIDATVEQGFADALNALKDAGIKIVKLVLPPLFEATMAAAAILLRVEAATYHRRWFPAQAGEYGPKLRAVIESGLALSAVEYLQARQVRTEGARQIRACFDKVDFWMTPSAPTVAPAGLSWTGDPVYNTPFSVAGYPALTLPSSWSSLGLPAGVQVAGAPYSENQLLRLALTLEEQGFGKVKPPSLSIFRGDTL